MFGPSNTNQTPPRLSLTFFVGAFLALLVAYLLLAGTAHEVLRYYLMPDTIALAHVTVLGWIALAIMGALYQLTPVLIQAPIVSVRLAWVQLATFVLGVAWFVESLAMARGNTLPFAAALTVVGVLLFLVNIWVSRRHPVHAGNDPWEANSLEWATTSPPPPHNFDSLPPIHSERPVRDARVGDVHPDEAAHHG